MQKAIFINSRLITVFLLGFSSGLPLALTYSTLQAWFTQAGVSLVTIGAVSLIGIPYTLKFLWAPLMDAISFPKVGRRKGWILLTQFLLVITLLFLANMQPGSQAGLMGAIALLIAFFAASQDISIDAYRTDILQTQERGLGASYFVFAYRIAMLVSGGLALICADHFGWAITYRLMALLILLSMLPTFFAPSPGKADYVSTNLFKTIKEAFRDLLKQDKFLLILIFIVLYKFGDALALSLMTTFLMKGIGFSLSEVGFAFKILSPIAIILGGLVGGVILTRWNIYYALILFGTAQAFSNLGFAVLASLDKHFWLMSSTIFIENFCSGLSTAALFAFLMSLCNKQYSASQYALLSAFISFGRVFLGPVAGVMVEHLGWLQFYIWSFLLCFPSILLLMFLKEKVMSYEPATAK